MARLSILERRIISTLSKLMITHTENISSHKYLKLHFQSVNLLRFISTSIYTCSRTARMSQQDVIDGPATHTKAKCLTTLIENVTQSIQPLALQAPSMIQKLQASTRSYQPLISQADAFKACLWIKHSTHNSSTPVQHGNQRRIPSLLVPSNHLITS